MMTRWTGAAVAVVMLVLGPGGSLAAPPAPTAIGVVLMVLASYHIASGNDQLAALFSRGAP